MKLSGDRKDIKSIYYFYHEEFKIEHFLKKIAHKNIRDSSFQTDEIEAPVESELMEAEVEFDQELLIDDLNKLNETISKTDRVKRKVQDTLNRLMF
jgi:hypothetical protein